MPRLRRSLATLAAICYPLSAIGYQLPMATLLLAMHARIDSSSGSDG